MSHIPAAERRRQIVEAAARVVGREGVSKATTRRICAEAKANIGTLHYTFSGKDDLLEAVLVYCWDVTSEIVEEAVAAASGPEGAAREILERYVELAIADPDLIAAQFQLLFWTLSQDGGRDRAEFASRELDKLVVSALRNGRWANELRLDEERLGRIVVSLIDGIFLRFVVTRSVEQVRADLETAIQLLQAAFAGKVSAQGAS